MSMCEYFVFETECLIKSIWGLEDGDRWERSPKDSDEHQPKGNDLGAFTYLLCSFFAGAAVTLSDHTCCLLRKQPRLPCCESTID